MSRFLTALLAGFALCAMASTANALTMTQTVGPVSAPLTQTNFATVFSFAKFNPADGNLISVAVTLNGGVSGVAQAENISTASGGLITLDLKATITLTDPLSNTLATVLPLATTNFNATTYDGTFDFGGSSGYTSPTLTNSLSVTNSYSTSLVLGEFTGTGNLNLNLAAVGSSSATGGGNIFSGFTTGASANATVVYTYSTNVPEPASMAILGVGLLGAGLLRRRAK